MIGEEKKSDQLGTSGHEVQHSSEFLDFFFPLIYPRLCATESSKPRNANGYIFKKSLLSVAKEPG